MSFRITGVDPEPFRHLFGLPEAALTRHGARRHIADAPIGFPDRVEMRDAAPGESLLLLNYTHAIFVREGADQRYDRVGEIPRVLRVRLISLRAFDAQHDMLDADVTDGAALPGLIERLFANPSAAYLHAHYAKPGCYACRIERA